MVAVNNFRSLSSKIFTNNNWFWMPHNCPRLEVINVDTTVAKHIVKFLDIYGNTP